jgi:hypothetical protein
MYFCYICFSWMYCVLAVVVAFIVVFLYCVCALFVCNVCFLSAVLLYYCHRVKSQLHFHKYIYVSNVFEISVGVLHQTRNINLLLVLIDPVPSNHRPPSCTHYSKICVLVVYSYIVS